MMKFLMLYVMALRSLQTNLNLCKKYFNESFHIENEYICQLNPCRYELIPEFIVQECDEYFGVRG